MSDKAYLQHFTRGGELLRADRVGEARVELEAALALRPEDARIQNLLGLAYFRLEKFADALGIYDRLVARQPEDAGLRLNLGLVHLKMGDVDAAIEHLARARTLDPEHGRVAGYLGLAYARRGEFAQARDAFLSAGQDELAREMESYLQSGGIGGGAVAAAESAATPAVADAPVDLALAADAAPAAAAPAVDAAALPAVEADAVPAVDAAVGVAALSAVEADAVPAAAPPPAKADAAPAAERAPAGEPAVASDVVRAPGSPAPAEVSAGFIPGVVEVAVRTAQPPVPADASVGAGEGHRAPEAIAAFATKCLIKPDDGNLPFEIGAAGLLVVRVRGRILSRTEGVILSGGELAYEPAGKRVRGRMTDARFGEGDHLMFFVSGHGHMVASPRGGQFAALELSDDIVYLREDLVFAFEEQLRWENGSVPGSGRELAVVQFRGEGCVALRTRRPPVTVKLAAGRVLYVDVRALAGWFGRVIPRLLPPVAGGRSSASFVECTGEGVVLVEEPGALEAR